MSTNERNSVVRKYEYCINCLAKSHTFRRCKSKHTCFRCQHYHHTLLHRATKPRIAPPSRQRQDSPQRQNTQPLKKANLKLVPMPSPANASTSTKRKPKIPKSSTSTKKMFTKPNYPKKTVVPNQRILSEAIKSLATVLCATQTP